MAERKAETPLSKQSGSSRKPAEASQGQGMECPCTIHTLSVLIMAPLRGRGGGGVLAYPAPKTPWEQTRDGPHPMWWMRFMNDIPYSIWLPPVAGRDGGWRQDGGQMRELGGQGTNFYLDSRHFLSCGPHNPSPSKPFQLSPSPGQCCPQKCPGQPVQPAHYPGNWHLGSHGQ